MKSSEFLIGSLIFVLIISAATLAQTGTPQNSLTKIAVVDTRAFYDKETGIKEIVEANDKLEAELKTQSDDLLLLAEKIQKLEKELNGMKSACYPPNPAKETIERKLSEYDSQMSNYKIKEASVRTLYEKRKAEIFADVYKKVGAAVKKFSKEKGYIIIIDISKCDSCLPGNYDGSDYDDVTNEFIKYYNENYTKLKTQ